MAEQTAIGWTDFTLNIWWGCSYSSPACLHCFAAALDRRTGGNYFEPGVLPRRTKPQTWNLANRMNRKAIEQGVRLKGFVGSMMDVMDNRVPEAWRDEMWPLLKKNTQIDWQLLTKRAPNIKKMLPADWGDGYDNVWLGVTVEDRKHGVPRIDHLRAVPAKVRFLSIEPLLEDLGELDLTGIHWVIIGGESGPGFRPIRQEWVDPIIAQCRAAGVAVFFKQWGGVKTTSGGCAINGTTIKEFPPSLAA